MSAVGDARKRQQFAIPDGPGRWIKDDELAELVRAARVEQAEKIAQAIEARQREVAQAAQDYRMIHDTGDYFGESAWIARQSVEDGA